MVTSIPDMAYHEKQCAAVCHFALDMLQELQRYNEIHPEHNLDMRIGINVGPVVAGIVGTKRFLYDIWVSDHSSAMDRDLFSVQILMKFLPQNNKKKKTTTREMP